MKKIIFLDIDGVLATPEYLKDGQWALNPEKQKMLGRILSETDAEIVLSSSWRRNSLEDTKEYMEEKGFLFVDKLIGVTIRAQQFIANGKGGILSMPRGVEIKYWIDTRIHSDHGKNWKRLILDRDYTYVILDDDCDMLLEHKNNFIRTESSIGLTDEDVEKAIAILNSKAK